MCKNWLKNNMQEPIIRIKLFATAIYITINSKVAECYRAKHARTHYDSRHNNLTYSNNFMKLSSSKKHTSLNYFSFDNFQP